MRSSAGRSRSSASSRSRPGGEYGLVDVGAEHVQQQELTVLPDGERGAHEVAGHLVEDPVEAAAQAGCRGGRRTDVPDRWECLQQHGLSCRVELDMSAEDDGVGVGQVGVGIVERRVADRHLDLAGRSFSRAAPEFEPCAAVQDRDVTRLQVERSADAVGGKPGPAARHRDERQRVGEGGARHPWPSRGETS
jgi:hypothetical protein